MRPAACRLLCLVILLIGTACEDCPDRKVPIDLHPGRVPRGTMQELEVRFPAAVFTGEDRDRRKDVRVDLRAPGGAVVGAWRGDGLATGTGAVTAARIDDPSSLTLRLHLDRSATAGPYQVTVIGDLAGACLGTWGTSTLTVT